MLALLFSWQAAVLLTLVGLAMLTRSMASARIPEAKLPGEDRKMPKNLRYDLPETVMVTGGSGFLGRHIVEALVANGTKVVIFDIVKRFDMEGVKVVIGNLCDKSTIVPALEGVDCVIHVASPLASSKNSKLFHAVNVDGTRNLLQACRECGVSRFVYTSSASVVYVGGNQLNVDESHAYPKKYRDDYCLTKSLAEQMVLDANCAEMRTAAIRPHGIFGPRDVQLMPPLVKAAKEGKMKIFIGDGRNTVDFTFVLNVVHGHLLAAAALTEGSKAAGEAFFITNDQPLPFWDFLSSCLAGLGYATPHIALPYSLMLAMSTLVDAACSALAPIKKISPTFTRSRVQILGTHHFYSCSKAKKLLGYEPQWTLREALDITIRSFQHLRNPDAPRDVDAPFHTFFTAEDIAPHNQADDAWIIVDGKVHDVTAYLPDHPGKEALIRNAGGDASEGFHGPQHPNHVGTRLSDFHIGMLRRSMSKAELDACPAGDVWIVVNGIVYNVTAFVDEHPGGAAVLKGKSGQDVSVGFYGSQHPADAENMLARYYLAHLDE